MKNFKYSIEEFGVIVALRNGKVRLCDKSVLPLLKTGKDIDESMLSNHRLEALEYDPDNFHLKHPLIVWIELTRACNCSCLHCYISAGKPREKELNTKQILQLISELNDKNVFHVVLTGGEPLLRQDLLQIIEYACNFDFTVSLLTNGTLLTEDIIRQFPKKNFVTSVSLDGFLTSAKLRGSAADAEIIKRNLLLLREHGIPMGVMSVMTKVNHHELVSLIEWCNENDISVTASSTLCYVGRVIEYPEIIPTVEDVELYTKIASLSKTNKVTLAHKWGFNNITFSSLMRFLWYLSFLTGMCEGSRGVSYITSEGDVYPCTTCAGTGVYKQGNILQTPFAEIWDGEFGVFRNITSSDFKQCEDCEISDEGWVCSGRCPPLSQNIHGDPFVCGYTQFQKESVKRCGKMYLEEHGNPSHYWPKEKT